MAIACMEGVAVGNIGELGIFPPLSAFLGKWIWGRSFITTGTWLYFQRRFLGRESFIFIFIFFWLIFAIIYKRTTKTEFYAFIIHAPRVLF